MGYHNGIAHFVEHTIFKGTARRSASVINAYLDRLGGELNAFTTKEEIVFHATVLKEDMQKAASLLLELVTSAIFPEHEVEVEKGVVLDEIQSYKDTPSEDIFDKFEELLFEGHPLSGNILGTRASVKKISREELLKFVKEKFLPCRMAFTVVADIDEMKIEKVVLKLADKYFPQTSVECDSLSDCKGGQVPCGQYSVPAAVQFDKTLNKRNHQANCVIGGLAPSLYQERERISTVLLCNILGGPANNSILNSVLREKHGWVYSVECGYVQFSDTGMVTISLGCDKVNLEKCVKAVYKVLSELQENLLSDRKLKAAKKQLLGQIAISGDNGENQCLSMGKGLLAYGKVSSGKENRALIDAVTAEDIREAARTVFDFSKLSKLIYI
jgi:predicted Zn-dependent peptidase